MTVEDILSKFDEKIVALALMLRAYILKELKNILELPDNSANIIGYGYGTGYNDMICGILLSRKAVKLSFYKGSELSDPGQLLTGTGKVHRFVEIKSEADIKNPVLKKLLETALAAYKKRKL
ncbi:MAG: DUF1801 domain-containing protein [Bacteroidota bacterium]